MAPEPTQADLDAAVEVARSPQAPASEQDTAVRELAAALAAVRLSRTTGTVSTEDLLHAHDAVLAGPLRHRAGRCLEDLAAALLEHGAVPAPDDYDGKWSLWWPKDGHGPCRDCGQSRSLTRYAARWGKPYRYLCTRCRKNEREHTGELAETATGITPRPEESSISLLGRRMTAQADPAPQETTTASALRPGEPTEAQWRRHADRLAELLDPLDWAGWEIPDSFDSDWDEEEGPVLYATLWRTQAAMDLHYAPDRSELQLNHHEPMDGGLPEPFSMIDDPVAITLAPAPAPVTALERKAGELGLLDASRVRIAANAAPDAADAFATETVRALFTPAAEYRRIPLQQVIREATTHPQLSTYLEVVAGMIGSDVQPDRVPDAATLGVASWCWRNNTAVESHHVESDVLMARINIAVTRIVSPHVDPWEGINWSGIEESLTDPHWALPDGRTISGLFGDGWSEVQATVREQLRTWNHIDTELIGPDTTLRLMTIGGSTSFTRHWWGQGRWRTLCEAIIRDALSAGITLPQPYDTRGATALADDLENPDLLSDLVLDWLIDMPDGGTGGPRGLRMHDITRPVSRTYQTPWA